MILTVYTDGACTSSGTYKGVGGWAYTIQSPIAQMEDAGGMIDTTNNRMEMEAVLRAFKQILDTKHLYDEDSTIIVYSDSELIVKTMNPDGGYAQKKNYDKWQEINKVVDSLEGLGFGIRFVWVKAHDKDIRNNKVDKMATKARDKMKGVLCWL